MRASQVHLDELANLERASRPRCRSTPVSAIVRPSTVGRAAPSTSIAQLYEGRIEAVPRCGVKLRRKVWNAFSAARADMDGPWERRGRHLTRSPPCLALGNGRHGHLTDTRAKSKSDKLVAEDAGKQYGADEEECSRAC